MAAKTKTRGTVKAKPKAKARKPKAKPAKAKPAKAKPAKTKSAKAHKPAPKKAKRSPRAPRAPRESKWVKLVAKHGVVLASAHGPVPTLTEAVAGEPIVGSWWAHPKGRTIFTALAELDDSEDVRCFKLIDHKVTFVHRRLWPALLCLARSGGLADDQVASIQQEHMPTGEHRNIVTALADWIDDATARGAEALSPAEARAQLGAWVGRVEIAART